MRWFVLTAILLVAVVLGVGFFVRARHGQPQPSVSESGTAVVTIPVEGMVCLACTARVKNTLRAINGVAEVEVSLEDRVARVKYIEGKVSREQLVSAINRLGYRAGTPQVEGTR